MSRVIPRIVTTALLALVLAGLPSLSFGFVRSTLSATDATPLRWDLDETMLSLSNVQGGEIVWVFDLAGSSNLPGPEDSEAVQRAFDHWEGSAAPGSRSCGPPTRTCRRPTTTGSTWCTGPKDRAPRSVARTPTSQASSR